MLLNDRSIQEAVEAGKIVIDPWDPGMLQPASVNLRLGRKFRFFRSSKLAYIDVMRDSPDLTEPVEIDEVIPLFLHPNEFVLGVILERICLPRDIAGGLYGKSSLGRLGLLVHSS